VSPSGACGEGGGGEKAAVAPLAKLASVKVKELDDEHVACAEALALLEQEESVGALGSVLSIFEKHFQHEEKLLDTHLYADVAVQAGGFNADVSMRKSHFADHSRILNEIRQEISRGQRCGPTAAVPRKFIDRVFRNFEQHADRYDGNYADRLQAALA